MTRKTHLPAAGEITHTAAQRSAELYDAARTRLNPLIDQSREQLDVAKKQGARYAADAVDKAQPALDDLFERLQNDLLPKLSDSLKKIADVDAVPLTKKEVKKAEKAADRLLKEQRKATKQAAKQARRELKSHTGGGSAARTIGGLALGAAVIAGAVALLRRFLTSNDDSGWAAHEPSTAYSGTRSNLADTAEKAAHGAENAARNVADKVKDAAQSAADKVADVAEKGKRAASEASDTVQDAAQNVKDGEQRPLAEAVDAAGIDSESSWGAGSYEGENPPEGYVIKGNARSKKFHVSGTGGYERTIADVWFNSEEAASAAGFTKAQR